MSSKQRNQVMVVFHILNLIDRPDRLKETLSEITKLNGVKKQVIVHHTERRSDGDGKLGCFLGHRSIWKKIANTQSSDRELHIICEDDLRLDHDGFVDAVYDVCEYRNQWDIVCFGWFPLSSSVDQNNEKFKRICLGGMAHCYSVSYDWANSNQNANYPGYNHDLWMFRDGKRGFRVVGHIPMVAYQGQQTSDIPTRMYKTRDLWWKLCPIEKTLGLSEKTKSFWNVFLIVFVLIFVTMIFKKAKRRRSKIIL